MTNCTFCVVYCCEKCNKNPVFSPFNFIYKAPVTIKIDSGCSGRTIEGKTLRFTDDECNDLHPLSTTPTTPFISHIFCWNAKTNDVFLKTPLCGCFCVSCDQTWNSFCRHYPCYTGLGTHAAQTSCEKTHRMHVIKVQVSMSVCGFGTLPAWLNSPESSRLHVRPLKRVVGKTCKRQIQSWW